MQIVVMGINIEDLSTMLIQNSFEEKKLNFLENIEKCK